jgi:hypothetical protein
LPYSSSQVLYQLGKDSLARDMVRPFRLTVRMMGLAHFVRCGSLDCSTSLSLSLTSTNTAHEIFLFFSKWAFHVIHSTQHARFFVPFSMRVFYFFSFYFSFFNYFSFSPSYLFCFLYSIFSYVIILFSE